MLLSKEVQDVNRLAEKIKKKYKTSDPFELARSLGITVLFEELGSIKGYYNTFCRQKIIHINRDMTRREQRLTAAHELGHALLHPNTNTYFLRTRTQFSVGSFEYEANMFAACLLISDGDIEENRELTTAQLACLLGYPEQLVQMRLKALDKTRT